MNCNDTIIGRAICICSGSDASDQGRAQGVAQFLEPLTVCPLHHTLSSPFLIQTTALKMSVHGLANESLEQMSLLLQFLSLITGLKIPSGCIPPLTLDLIQAINVYSQ